MKLITSIPSSINISEMLDGDIGIITKWCSDGDHIGEIVQRFGNALVSLGRGVHAGWPGFFEDSCIIYKSGEFEKFQVFILPEGSQIEI